MNTHSETAIRKALSTIKNGDALGAKKELEEAFLDDLESKNLRICISFCAYWIGAFKEVSAVPSVSRGDYLLLKWSKFEPWARQFSGELSPATLYQDSIYAFKTCVYTMALEEYGSLKVEDDQKLQAELFRKTGLCHKRLGNYDTALELLKESNSLNPGQPEILSEMADCYELCGESKLAKILYREAFFVDPERVSIDNLDSPLIQDLISRIKETKEYSGNLLQEWIPVYGILLGAFNIKRPLKSQEVGRLKQTIYAKENELKAADNKENLVPRLMNLYLWLMDYYLLSKESTPKINELLLKIKMLDPEIYEEYFK